MPLPKSWIGHVSQIINYLEADSADRYRRFEVEKIFGVSSSAAKEIMTVAGAKPVRPGLDRTISRVKLLAYVKYSPDCQAEIERQREFASRMREAEEEQKLRSIPLGVTAKDEWTKFADIPNVVLEPGLLQIRFTPGDPVGLLDAIYRFGKAACNQRHEFERMCGIQRRAS